MPVRKVTILERETTTENEDLYLSLAKIKYLTMYMQIDITKANRPLG